MNQFANIIVQTDSYKFGGHFNMYPENTEYNYAYFESRTGAKFDKTVFVGLQYILQTYFEGPVVTREKIELAAQISRAHFGSDNFFNRKGWEYILEKHKGYLPLRIKAVPEGTPVSVANILMSVENTDPKCAWLTNFVESILTHVWYPSTVASLSYATKQVLKEYLDKTSDNPEVINFQLHDFGYRGTSSNESAALGGFAHLVNFSGTDTVVAFMVAMKNYFAPIDTIGYSVAASEHSIMTARGRDGETEVVDQLLLKYPNGILSVVADSYDVYNFVENIVGKQFKDRILRRNGVFVVRPDSITPLHPTPESEMLWIVQRLAYDFGYTYNTKGYMVLNPKVRVLWGDGIDLDGIKKILEVVTAAGYSSENLVFGMGGGLLQKINRDTQRFAFKSSAQRRSGNWYDIYKQPKDLSKASKRGKLTLLADVNGGYQTVPQIKDGEGNYMEDPCDKLQEVFINGHITKITNLAEIRNLAK